MKHFKLTESERKRISGLYEQSQPVDLSGGSAFGQSSAPSNVVAPQGQQYQTNQNVEPAKETAVNIYQTPGQKTEQTADLKTKIIELQNLLISKGQSLGRFGADGKIGNHTLTAIENVLSGTKGSATPNTNAPAAGTTAGTNQPSKNAGTTVGTDPTANANQPLAAKTTSTNPPAATDNNPPEY